MYFIKYKLLGAAIVILLSLGFASCKPDGKEPASGQGGMAPKPPPEVTVVTVRPQTVPVTMEYNGQITGVRDIEVRARVTGILLKRNFLEGAPISAGSSMFTIDPEPFQVALARAEADLVSAEARWAKAKRDVARLKQLIEEQVIPQRDYDDALFAEQSAAADVESIKTRVAESRLNLSYTRVEAPISGIAGRIQVTEGSLISGPDVRLTTVTQIDPIYVSFGLSDNERLQLNGDAAAGRLALPKNGMFNVIVKLADGSTYARQGKMNFSDIRISTATGTSEARAELLNPKGTLRPGQFVRVTLIGAQRLNAILVPQRAVLEEPQGKFVYVANSENKAENRPVEAGEWIGNSWMIRKGLQAGERVIVDGVVKVNPGVTVKVVDGNASDAPVQPETGNKKK